MNNENKRQCLKNKSSFEKQKKLKPRRILHFCLRHKLKLIRAKSFLVSFRCSNLRNKKTFDYYID